MHHAAHYGHAEMAAWLIKAGLKPNTCDNKGSTPLHEAVKIGNVTVVKLLLLHNANPYAKAVVVEGQKSKEVWPIYHATHLPAI